MRLDVVTIFPEYLEPLRAALLGKAIERGLISVDVHDLRSWTHDVHKAVDDSPYGGDTKVSTNASSTTPPSGSESKKSASATTS
jgi:tRNA (guanine-N1)-methyltransferase